MQCGAVGMETHHLPPSGIPLHILKQCRASRRVKQCGKLALGQDSSVILQYGNP